MPVINVMPAYGRDYKSKDAVQDGWDAGHDFFVTDHVGHFGGSYMNKNDHAVYAPDHSIIISYKKHSAWHTIKPVQGKR